MEWFEGQRANEEISIQESTWRFSKKDKFVVFELRLIPPLPLQTQWCGDFNPYCCSQEHRALIPPAPNQRVFYLEEAEPQCFYFFLLLPVSEAKSWQLQLRGRGSLLLLSCRSWRQNKYQTLSSETISSRDPDSGCNNS